MMSNSKCISLHYDLMALLKKEKRLFDFCDKTLHFTDDLVHWL